MFGIPGILAAQGARRASAGGAAFTAEAVTFDGTNDYMQGTVTEPTSAKTFLLSFWYRFNTFSSVQLPFIITTADNDTSGGGFYMQFSSGNGKIGIQGYNSSGTRVLQMVPNFVFTTGQWYHIMASGDLSDQGSPLTKRHFYVDNVEYTDMISNSWTNQNISWETYAQVSNYNGSQRCDADIAELYVTNEYLDLSSSTNRAKFVDGSPLSPVDLGSDGSTPTGTQPHFYFKGAASVWNGGTNNSGSAGHLTMNGSVADSTNEPVEVGA